MNPGERAEVLVSVNASSFRTIGLVKAMVENSRACMEFVHMSAGSRGLLADLLAQISRLQAVVATLRSARAESEAELFRQLDKAGVRSTLYGGVPLIGRTLNEKRCESGPVSEPETNSQSLPLLIRVDLFG